MLDPVTKQHYLRARFYNLVIGSFTQEDTYYGDGLNLYQYCQANPVGYVDPSGHSVCPVLKSKEEYRKQHPEATIQMQKRQHVWHHLDDYDVEKNTITMELVMDEAHNTAKPHSGGCAQYDSVNGPTCNRKKKGYK